jgi:hypothetical protein
MCSRISSTTDHEVPNDIDGGRPFTRCDDVIPPPVKAYNGKVVAITSFVMPLRLRKGLVTERPVASVSAQR